MKLYRKHLEKFDPSRRDTGDRRKWVTWAVFSYLSETGEEYRRAFTAPKDTPETKMWEIAPKELTI